MVRRPGLVLVVAGALFVCTNGPVFHLVFRVLDRPVAWEAPVVREIYAAIAVAGLVFGARAHRRSAPVRDATATVAVWGFTAVCVASVAWSIDPSLTAGRALVYVGLAGWATVIADLGDDEWLAAVSLAVGACVVLGLVAVVVSPTIGVDAHGDWRGIHPTRNAFGPLAGMGVVLGAGVAAAGRSHRAVGSGLSAVSAIALLGSGSRTAAVATALGLLVAVVALVGLPSRRRFRIGLLAATAAGAVVGIRAAWDVSTLGRRRELWELAWDRILERPVLGHGWFTVWRDTGWVDTDPLLRLGNAHSSVLDVLLGIGIVGLVPFVAVVGSAGRNAWRAASRRPDAVTVTRLGIVTLLLVEHVTESFVLLYSYNWVLLMAAALAAGGAGRPGPGRRTPAPTATATG